MHDQFRILYRLRRTVLAGFLVVVGLVAAYSFLATPIYEAHAVLVIETTSPKVVNFDEVMAEAKAGYEYYLTQAHILRSHTLARKTMDALRAWDHPEFSGTPRSRSGRLLHRASDRVRALFGWSSSPEERDSTLAAAPAGVGIEPETAAQSRAIATLLDRLTVYQNPDTRVATISFRSSDPILAAAVVNTLAAVYVESDRERRLSGAKEAAAWLQLQLEDQRKQVEKSELALQRYREQNDVVSLEDRQNEEHPGIVTQKLADLNAAVTKAKTVRIEKEALYEQLQSIQHDPGAHDAFSTIVPNAFIQTLKGDLATLQNQRSQLAERFGDQHPEMIKLDSAILTAQKKLETEIGKVVESVKAEYLTAQTQERRLGAALDTQKAEALGQTRKAIEYRALQRDAASSRQVYEALLLRAKETGVSSQLQTSNVRIVDAAEIPRTPVFPNKLLNLLLGVLLGGVFGIGLAMAVDRLDDRITSPEQIEGELGLPLLGLIPSVTVANLPAGGTPLFGHDVPATFTETFHKIRANILLSSGDTKGIRTFLITSSTPGEGKTLAACNLALVLASTSARVVLVDADMRIPRVNRIFGQPQTPGLADVLEEDMPPSEAVRPSGVPHLWLLPAGHSRTNSAILLASESFAAMIASLSQRFEYVVIDSPPVMPVVDACLAAAGDAAVVFVVRAGVTSRRVAQRALGQLDSAGGRFAGALLNAVDLDRNQHYYSDYYGANYNRYYADPPRTRNH